MFFKRPYKLKCSFITSLKRAVKHNSASKLKKLLHAKRGWHTGVWTDYNLLIAALRNAVDKDGNTPLHLAFFKYNEDDNKRPGMVNTLMDAYNKKEGFTNVENNNGLSYLHIACSMYFEVSIVQKFIAAGADVNGSVRCGKFFAGFTPLHFAVESNNQKLVELLLKLGADVNAVNFHKSTPIHLAKLPYGESITLLLLSHDKKEKNLINDEGLSHFHIACSTDSTEIVEMFFSKKVDVNHITKSNNRTFPSYSALHFAVAFGCVNTTRLLLTNGADIFAKNGDSHTPLHLAYYNNYTEIMHILLQAQKNNCQNSVDKSGLSHFHIACATYKISIIKRFLENKVDINMPTVEESSMVYANSTPLHIAVSHNNLKVVKLLLANHADVNSKTKNGYTALHLACNGHKDIDYYFKSLEKKKKDIFDIPKEISLIADWIKKKKIIQYKIAKILLKNNIDVNALDSCGRSALFYVYDNKFDHHVYTELICPEEEFGYRERFEHFINPVLTAKRVPLFEIILNNGADVKIEDEASTTVLHLIANVRMDYARNEEYLVQRIIKKGADVNKPNILGDTPLHLAAKNNFAEMIDVLLRNNANVNCVNKSLETPLHLVIPCLKDRVDVTSAVFRLLVAGININCQQKEGKTALHIAVSQIMYSAEDIFSNERKDSCICTLVAILIVYNVEVDIQDHKGKTALHYASQFVAYESIKILLKCGANINVQDNCGLTPVAYWFMELHNSFLLHKVFIEHLEKLRIIHYYISEKNLHYCETLKMSFNFHVEIKKLKEMCLQELNDMKNIMIDKYSSLYDILFKNVNQLAIYARNEKFIKVVIDKHQSFPLYGYLLPLKLDEGLFRNTIIDDAKKSLYFVIQFNLPEYCLEAVLQYLSNSDLVSIIKSANNFEKFRYEVYRYTLPY